MNVLIAEDETIIRLDLRGILERHGFTVCAEARDGVEAVELARTTAPDVVLLDLRMPNLDGIEAARRIYAERPVPIVMLTAFDDRATVEKAIAAGVFAYLVEAVPRERRRPGAPRSRSRGTRSCWPRARRLGRDAAAQRSRSRSRRRAATSGRCGSHAGRTGRSTSG